MSLILQEASLACSDPMVSEAARKSKLQCADVCAQSLQSCLVLCDPMDHGHPGSSVHGILQARILEWAPISFSRHVPSKRLPDWASLELSPSVESCGCGRGRELRQFPGKRGPW